MSLPLSLEVLLFALVVVRFMVKMQPYLFCQHTQARERKRERGGQATTTQLVCSVVAGSGGATATATAF